MENGGSNNGTTERRIVSKDTSWCGQFRNASNPWMARYVYALIFLVANLLAWAARDYGRGALTEMESKIAEILTIDFMFYSRSFMIQFSG